MRESAGYRSIRKLSSSDDSRGTAHYSSNGSSRRQESEAGTF
jgi:hypothetical protein